MGVEIIHLLSDRRIMIPSFVRFRPSFLLFSFVVAVVVVGGARRAAATPLDDYVAAPDPSYEYALLGTIPGLGFTAYVLDMKSQQWRTPAEVNPHIWQHWLLQRQSPALDRRRKHRGRPANLLERGTAVPRRRRRNHPRGHCQHQNGLPDPTCLGPRT